MQDNYEWENRIGEKRLNNFGAKMELIEYEGKGKYKVLFPEYGLVKENILYGNYIKGKVSLPKKYVFVGVGGYNSFGSKMIIKEYRKNSDMDVYFPEYNWTFEHAQLSHFTRGNLRCPYERRYFNVGYIGEGKYNWQNYPNICNKWLHILERSYSKSWKKNHPQYNSTTCGRGFHCLQDFGQWYENNIYEVKMQVMDLDKDLLGKGNKIYSPETCCFLPRCINSSLAHPNKELLTQLANKYKEELPKHIYYALINY